MKLVPRDLVVRDSTYIITNLPRGCSALQDDAAIGYADE